MKRIKTFNELTSAPSGGFYWLFNEPNYGKAESKPSLNNTHTSFIQCDVDDKLYCEDDYVTLYIDYLKKGGRPLNGFNKENLNTVIEILATS